MKIINRIFLAISLIVCYLTILYFITLFLLKQTSADSVLGFIVLGISSVVLAFFSLIMISMTYMSLVENISLAWARKYYKANKVSSKMKNLENELYIINSKIGKSNNSEYKAILIKESNEIENKINKINGLKPIIQVNEEEKLNLKIFGYIFFFTFFSLLLSYTEPKELILYHEYEKNWLTFFVILILNITILIYRIKKPIKSLINLTIWICAIIVLAIILFFTKPFFIALLSTVELFWYVGCCLFISTLSIVICKTFE